MNNFCLRYEVGHVTRNDKLVFFKYILRSNPIIIKWLTNQPANSPTKAPKN